MKLRNKKTGEIIDIYKGQILLHYNQGKKTILFKSIEELEEWEDYEEPKEYWFISTTGKAHRFEGEDEIYTPDRKQLGNYFETKEEAEKAIEKLKAWKRLKDKGFKFIGKTYETDKRFGSVFYKVDEDTYSEDIILDLDLLFSQEDD